MPIAYRDEDDEGDQGSTGEWEAPDESDTDDEDDEAADTSDTVPCPYCRRSVYEFADLCPYCGSFISQADAPTRHPWWIVAGVFVCLAVVILLWVL